MNNALFVFTNIEQFTHKTTQQKVWVNLSNVKSYNSKLQGIPYFSKKP